MWNANDHFRFSLTRTRGVYIQVSGPKANAVLLLYDANGVLLVSQRRPSTYSEHAFRQLAPGTYYIRVNAVSTNRTINYRLGFLTTDVIDLGNVTRRSGTRTGSVNSTNDEADGYRFTLRYTTSMRFFLGSTTPPRRVASECASPIAKRAVARTVRGCFTSRVQPAVNRHSRRTVRPGPGRMPNA